MKKYSQYLEQYQKNHKIYERAINPKIKNKIHRLKETEDFKNLLKMVNDTIDKIKEHSKKIDYNNINYQKHGTEIRINYDIEMLSYLHKLDELVFGIDDDNFLNKIFQDGYRDLYLEISLNGEFNQIDILNGLPNFMKNLGLGKKIYKKLIKDFDFISSFEGFNPSIDSDMVWNKIADDPEIFTFSNDDNFISFWNDYDFDHIIEILKKFYKITGTMFFDQDFCQKFNIKEKQLKNLLS